MENMQTKEASPGPAARTLSRAGLFPTLHGYQRSWLRTDVVAGLTLWAVSVPQALAYASIAGAPLVVGLYAVPAGILAYAVVGSSGQLNMGPMSSMAAMSAAAVAQFATPGSNQFTTLTLALAVTTGVLGLVAAVLRLGFLTSFISEPIMMAYMAGLALNIMVGQLPKLFGVDAVGGMEANFFQQLAGVLGQLGAAHVLTLVIGLAVVAIVLGLKRLSPVLPGALIAVGLGILAARLFPLAEAGVATVGTLPRGLPRFGVPTTNLQDYLQLLPAAAGILVLGYAEGLGVARTYATRQAREISAGRELLGLGLANVASGLSSGMIVNGSVSRTVINATAGAKTQVSGLVTAAMTLLTLLFLTGLFTGLPQAVLAGIVIAAVWDLLDPRMLRMLYAVSDEPLTRPAGIVHRPDFVASLATVLGVLVFGNLEGLAIGIAISLLLLLSRAARPHVTELGHVRGTRHHYTDLERDPEGEAVPGITVLRPEGGLFFANADYVRDRVLAAAGRPGTRAIVLDMQTVPWTDVTGVEMLRKLGEDLDRMGVRLAVARPLGEVRALGRRVIHDSAVRDVYPTVQAAVTAMRGEPERTDPSPGRER